MTIEKTTRPRGIVLPHGAPRPFTLRRYEPAPALAGYVEDYWVVRWALPPGAVHVQYTLGDPTLHVVFEPGSSRVVGVALRRFERRIEGHGGVFGVKFRPGAFRPLMSAPVSALSDRMVPLVDVFGAAGEAIDAAMTAATHDATAPDDTAVDTARVALVEAFLTARLPAAPPGDLAYLQQIVLAMGTDATLLRVDDVVARFGVQVRALQRWFDDTVGASPKWVIKRRRIQDALARLDAAPDLDPARLALGLGYCDQAHFARDFRAIVGMTPGAYVRGGGR